MLKKKLFEFQLHFSIIFQNTFYCTKTGLWIARGQTKERGNSILSNKKTFPRLLFPDEKNCKKFPKKKYFFHFQSIWFDRSYFSVNPAFSRIHILWKNLLKVLGFPIIYKFLLIVFKRFFFPNHILNLFYLICLCSN